MTVDLRRDPIGGVDAYSGSNAVFAKPCVFGESPSLVGWYHAPRSRPRSRAVLLCNPIGYEGMLTHRAYWALAESLAADGIAALRFDYEGCGDSLGGEEGCGDSVRWGDWVRSIQLARAELQARSGCSEVCLFGVRLGGTLAALAAEEQPVENIILWSPVVGGRAHLRELRAFSMIKGEGRLDAPRVPGVRDGCLEVAGHVLGPEIVTALKRVDLLTAKPKAGRALLLKAAPQENLEPLRLRLGASGASATVEFLPGYPEMMRDTHVSTVPEAIIQRTLEWLREPVPLSTTNRKPSVRHEMRLAGSNWIERPVVFGPRGDLTGILTEPTPSSRAQALPTLVLPNVGANHHIGPSRLWVRLARTFAALGFPVLRFDIAGLGDSPSAGAAAVSIYSLRAIADGIAAVEFVSRETSGQGVVIVGECSGAYVAYYAALRAGQVRGLVMINLQTFDWRPGDPLEAYQSAKFYLQSTLVGSTWRRFLSGELNTKGIARHIAERALSRRRKWMRRRLARLRWREATDETSFQPGLDVSWGFRRLLERDVDTLLIYGEHDSGLQEIGLQLGHEMCSLRAAPNFRLATIAESDHTFTARDARDRLVALLVSHLNERFPARQRASS